jgi:hypothetical protein
MASPAKSSSVLTSQPEDNLARVLDYTKQILQRVIFDRI